MRKVRRAIRGLAFLGISLAMVLGLGFGFAKRDAVEVRAEEKNFQTQFYTLTYSSNEITLLFNADISVYKNFTKDDVSGLKNSLVETLQEALSDDIDLDALVSNTNGAKALPKLAPVIDTSTVDGIVTSLLEDIESVDNAVAAEGTYDKMLSYYVDRYVANYVAANNITNPAEIANVYQDVATSITAALQNRVETIYNDAGASPAETEEALQSVADKVETVVADVKDTNENGQSVEVNLSDVTEIVNSITNADASTLSNVSDLIQELQVEDELKGIVTSSTSDELTDFLNNVNMDVVVEVVKTTNIEKQDVVDIINTIGADNLVEVANNIGVDSLKELAQSVNLTTEELQDIIVSNMADISFTTLTKLIDKITLDGVVVFKDGGLEESGVKEILRGLPRPTEIANYTDDQMRLSYDVEITTTYGDVDFDLTIGFFGDASKIRRAAKLVADTVDVNVENGVYNVTLTAPEATDNLLLYLSDTAAISDELKLELFDNAFLTAEEFYNSIDVAEYVRMFRDIDYQTIVDTFTSADELNDIFETNKFTDARIKSLVNDLNALVNRLADVSFDQIKNLVGKFTSDNPLDNSTLESKANQVLDYLQRLADKNINYDLLRQFAQDGTGLDIDGALERVQNDQAKLDKIQKALDRVYSVLPESLKQTSILDLYQGNGQYTLQDTYNLDYEDIFTKLFGQDGTTLYNKFSGLFGKLPSTINLNLNATLNGVYKVTYHVDSTNTRVGLLPVGADVAFYGEDDELSWMLADGTPVDKMLDADIDVYPVPEVVINNNVSPIEFTYDGQSHEITSVVTPDDAYTYTYQWTKDGVNVEGATSATLNVKNVADTGKYVLKVTATEINYVFDSNEVEVKIAKAKVDVSGLEWNYDELEPFTYDGQEHTVALENIPATIKVEYTDAAKTNAGNYTAKATPTLLDAKNYEIVGTIADCAWTVEKAKLDLSGLTWNYTNPFTYDGQEHTVTVNVNEFPAGVSATYENNAKTNAGNYVAVATPVLADPNNYEVSGAIPNCEWVINKAVVDLSTLTWNYTAAFTYDGQEHEVALTNVPATISVKYTDAAKTDAGNYTAKAQATLVDAANYELSGAIADCAWVINKASIDLSGINWDYAGAIAYDGNEHTIELDGTIDHVTFSYTGNKATNAGSYTAHVDVVVDANYEVTGTIADLNWEISKLQFDASSLTWNYAAAFEYDGTAKTVTLNNVPNYITVTYTGNSATEAGNYTATASLTADANHEITGSVTPLNWEIKKAEQPSDTTVLQVLDANGNVIAEVTILNGTFPDSYTLHSDPVATGEVDYSSILGKNQEVKGGQTFDIFFDDAGTRTGIATSEGYKFKVRLAIPSDLVSYSDDKLRVVYIDDGKIAETFEFTRVGNYVEFETTHFSMYAVLGIADKAPNLWWLWLLIALLVLIIIILIILLLRKKYSVIELYKESGKIFVDGKEVVVAEEFDTVELFKESGKIFVNGNELEDEDNTPEPPAGEFEVVELFKETGEIFVNGNKDEDEELFELDKNSGDLLLNKKEYDFYNNLNHSFKARLIRTHDEVKQYYSEIKNDILSYKLGGKKEISNRLSWRHETFNIGREGLVEFKMRRTALVVYLPLNASDYVDTKYKVEEAGENLCKFVIKNDRRCKYAKDLIAVVMERNGLTKVEREAVDYTAELQTKSVNELIKEGLIKE